MVLEKYLKDNGFKERAIECVCPHCVTVAEFVMFHPKGRYVLICADKSVFVVDGYYVDTDDSCNDVVIYYFEGDERCTL